MKNSDYWKNRMRILEEALLDKGYAYVKNLESQYNIAIAEIDKQIAAWFQRFAKNNGISLAEAKKLLNSNELEEFRWTVAEYIRHGEENALSGEWTKQLENASSRVHISRLDSLKIQLRQEAEALHGGQLQATESLLGEIYREGYSHTAFEVQKGIGFAWSFVGVDSTRLEKVLARPWTADGQTFRDRVWTNKDALVNSVNTQITQMIMRGEAPDKAIKNIAHQFNVSKKKAGRLVMTESAAFASFSQKDCYDDLGVEKYEIVETPDTETCEVCGELDGKVFNMSDFQVGTTAPPFHPWCRGFTAPWYEDMQNIGARAARDAVTGESCELPAGTTYKQWKEMQDAKYGAGTVDKMRKRSYNETADRAQFESYIAVLGKQSLPKSFNKFQDLKYDNAEEWEKLKRQYREGHNSLQAQLPYYYNGEKNFIPNGAVIYPIRTIAGKGSKNILRVESELIAQYGGEAGEWKKRVGKVESDKYIFDVHWYELNGRQYKMKLKNRGEKNHEIKIHW